MKKVITFLSLMLCMFAMAQENVTDEYMYIHRSDRSVERIKIAEIDNLQKELRDVKHEALTLSSELLGKSKQSQIKFLLSQKDSSLNILDCPPFVIELY